MISNDYLKQTCANSHAMACLLQSEIKKLNKKDLNFRYPVQANVIFLQMTPELLGYLQSYFIGVDEWGRDEEENKWVLVRVMTSYSTTKEKVFEFIEALKSYYKQE